MDFLINLQISFTLWRLARVSARQRRTMFKITKLHERMDALRLRAATRRYRKERSAQ